MTSEINPNEIMDEYPLSPMQRGMLFHTLYSPRKGVYTIQLVGDLQESLDVPIFRLAWEKVIERHTILRTGFHWIGEENPVQKVHVQAALIFEEHDFSHLSFSEQAAQIEQVLDEDFQRGIDLTTPPLMRLLVIKLGEKSYKFIRTSHHLLTDGRTSYRLYREAFALYEAFCQGETLELEPPIPYRRYIDWLESKLTPAWLEEARLFWRQNLAGFNHPTPLLTGQKLDAAERGSQYRQVETSLSERVSGAIKRFSEENSISCGVIIQGAWAVLLSRYSGEEDVVFGATRAARRVGPGEIMEIVGPVLNTIPLRVKLPAEMRVVDWLAELQRQWIELRPFEITPLENFSEYCELGTGQVMFDSLVNYDYHSLGSALRSLGGNWANRNFHYRQGAGHPLSLSAFGDEPFKLAFTYDAGRFDEPAIWRMSRHLTTILEGMTEKPGLVVAKVPILGEEERQRIVVGWNATQVVFAETGLVHQMIESQARKNPETTAVLFNGAQLTYRQLDERANQLAHYLIRAGVKPDSLVGLCMERSLEMVVGILGVLKSGGAYVPLDPEYPAERLRFMIEDSRTQVLLTQAHLAGKLPAGDANVCSLDSGWDEIAAESTEVPRIPVQMDHQAYMIYTSGSTGVPKGVMIPHRALRNHMLWMAREFPLTEADKVLQRTPFSFDASIWEFYAPLMSGARLILAKPGGHKDVPYLIDLIILHEITVIQTVPSILRILVDNNRFKACSSLRLLFCGGEPLPVDLLPSIQATLNAEIVNLYGPTETCIDSITWKVPRGFSSQMAPIGRPIANVQAYILDHRQRVQPEEIPGELYLGGDCLGRGYLNRVELTEERFVTVPDGLGEVHSKIRGKRLFRSGDLACWLPDGNIEYLGRLDDQVKLHGLRIELGEIETLLNQHHLVKQAAVVVHRDSQGNQTLLAYIVSHPGKTVKQEDLVAALRKRLPAHMIPEAFVFLDMLPLAPNGKIDRRALPSPKLEQHRAGRKYVPPTTFLEKALAGIWGEVLNVEQLGMNDNFFELGGHSLQAMRLASQVSDLFQVSFPLHDLFDQPTIRGMVDSMRKTQLDGEKLERIAEHLLRLAEMPDSTAEELLKSDIQQAIGKPG